jgi:hypothetical protein
MVELARGLELTLEALDRDALARDRFVQHFDRDALARFDVTCLVHATHRAVCDPRHELVRTEPLTEPPIGIAWILGLNRDRSVESAEKCCVRI